MISVSLFIISGSMAQTKKRADKENDLKLFSTRWMLELHWISCSRIVNSPQTKGPVVCLGSKQLLCVQPQWVHVPEEELGVPLHSSPNTNWIVKAEQLVFGNVVINSGLHPVEYHSLSKKQCVHHWIKWQCVLPQSLDLEAFLFLHFINVSSSSFYLMSVLPLHSFSEDGWAMW